MIYGWKDIQEATQPLRGTDASEKVMVDIVDEVPDLLLDLVSKRELIVAKIPPPLPEVTLGDLASNNGSVFDISELTKKYPMRRPVWVSYKQNVYDMTCKCYFDQGCVRRFTHRNTAIWEYGDGGLQDTIERYKGQMIPTGPFSARLEQEFSYRVVGVLAQNRRPPRKRVWDNDDGDDEDDDEDEEPNGSQTSSKRRAIRVVCKAKKDR